MVYRVNYSYINWLRISQKTHTNSILSGKASSLDFVWPDLLATVESFVDLEARFLGRLHTGSLLFILVAIVDAAIDAQGPIILQ